MCKTLGLSLLVLTSFLAAAQDTPRFEAFGGYAYANASKTFALHRPNLNGWNASLTGNFNRWFGVTADFGGYYGSSDTAIPVPPNPIPPCAFVPPFCPIPFTFVNVGVHFKTHTFLAGPQFSWRRERFTLFAHELFGAGHTGIDTDRTNFLVPGSSSNAFALAAGGGIDINLNSRLAWRVQPDYLRTTFFHSSQNNLRVSTGLVFKFGSK